MIASVLINLIIVIALRALISDVTAITVAVSSETSTLGDAAEI